MIAKVTLALFFLVAAVAGNVSVNIIMSARNLPNTDISDGSPDPFVRVLKAEGASQEYGIVGTTARFDNQNNPDWPEVFNFNYVAGTNQRLRFEVLDYDFDADDYMGKVDLTLQAIVESASSLEVEIEGCPTSNCGRFRVARQLNGEITPGMDPRFINPKTVIVAQ